MNNLRKLIRKEAKKILDAQSPKKTDIEKFLKTQVSRLEQEGSQLSKNFDADKISENDYSNKIEKIEHNIDSLEATLKYFRSVGWMN